MIALLVGFSIPLVFMPILNDIVEIICNQCEIIKGSQIKKITEINIENTKLAEELENSEDYSVTNAIGFEIPNTEEEEYIEE